MNCLENCIGAPEGDVSTVCVITLIARVSPTDQTSYPGVPFPPHIFYDCPSLGIILIQNEEPSLYRVGPVF